MDLKLVIEKPVSSKKEYELIKSQGKLSNETWKLIDPDKDRVLDLDLCDNLKKKIEKRGENNG